MRQRNRSRQVKDFTSALEGHLEAPLQHGRDSTKEEEPQRPPVRRRYS